MQAQQSAHTSAQKARLSIRSGEWTAHTSGLAPGFVQGNVVILTQEHAGDFLRYCQRNPKPCPLLAVSEPGDPRLPMLAQDVDIRTDLPKYRIWVDGKHVEDAVDIRTRWSHEMVTFVLGCSFSFEQALLEAQVPLRYIAEGKNVAMYRTNIATEAAGPFHGPLVVSMRAMSARHAIRAIQITSRYPGVHGAPVHFGDPRAIGIADIEAPDYGDAPDLRPGEVPVFWACGVTPQAAIQMARPGLCITHAPGYMLITDLLNAELAQ